MFNVEGDNIVGLMFDNKAFDFDEKVCEDHPETSNRVWAILEHLQRGSIFDRFKYHDDLYDDMKLKWRQYCNESLLAVHSENHVNLIKNIGSNQFDALRNEIASELDSRYFNPESSEAAFFAAACALKAVDKVARGKLNSAFAIVRPPGHLAERDKAKGFCLYNNVAVAAIHLLNKAELGIRKILIVDWDICHGSGTQKIFWQDSQVLFFSVHRHEGGSSYPVNGEGFYTKIGEGAGAGYTINVPWNDGERGNADYFAVWDHILLPVAKEFDPDMIIVSAGFSKDVDDPFGDSLKDGHVTPYGYSVLLEKLSNFAYGRIVMVLEGGYDFDFIIKSIDACLYILLGDRSAGSSLVSYFPYQSTWDIIKEVRRVLSPYWPTLASELPQELLSQVTPPTDVSCIAVRCNDNM